MVKIKGVLLALFLFSIFVFISGFASAVPISSCTSITSSGEYTLSNNLVVSPQNVISGRCIAISASNVVLDCQGKLIDDYSELISGSLIYSTGLNTTIKNCVIYPYYVYGIVLDGASNSKIYNNSFIGSYAGISLSNTLNSFIYNISSSEGSNLIRLNQNSNNNSIYNLNLNSTQFDNLISLSNSHNNTFSNFKFLKSNGYSIFMQSSSNNTFYQGNLTSVSTYGVYLDSSRLNSFNQINFNGNNAVFYSSLSTDNYIYNSIFDSSFKATLSSSGLSSLYLVNSSHNKSFENVLGISKIYNGWYLDSLVLDGASGVSGANLNIYNSTNDNYYSTTSDNFGKNRLILYEYVNTGGSTIYYGNYSVNVSKNGYSSSSQSVNISGNKQITFNIINLAGISITAQPQGANANVGGSVSFNVVASGTGPFNYQWRKEGVNIAGATSSTYTKTNLQLGDSGNYSVNVSNSYGSVISNIANLNVTNIPSITPPVFINEYETAWDTSTTTRTTSTFNVEAGDVLVAYSIFEGSGSTGSISGGSLTWNPVQQVLDTDYARIYVWSATVDSAKSMSVTFTSSVAQYFGGNVLVFRNSDGIGNSSKRVASVAPTLSLTTTQANSAIVVASGDWNANDGANRAWLTNAGTFNERTYAHVLGRYTVYGGYHNQVNLGTYNVGLSSPATQKSSIVGVEVKGKATTQPTFTYHPSDSSSSGGNQNQAIDYSEVNNYINGYFSGSVSSKNALHALTIRQSGGSYNYIGNFLSDCNNYPWNCWVNI